MATTADVLKIVEAGKEVDHLNPTALGREQLLMKGITKLLDGEMLKYNWAGFLILDPGTDPPVLGLGDCQVAKTPPTRIPLHQGISGAAASSGKTLLVDDVSMDSRSLACSLETKSEIVVPVVAYGKVVAELDIDSHFPDAFTSDDGTLAEYCTQLVGKRLEQTSGESSF